MAAPRLPGLAMIAFAAFATIASLRYAALIVEPPTLRILGVVAVCTLAGGLITAGGALGNRWAETILRVLFVAAAAYTSLRLAGAPARSLLPWDWHELARRIADGTDELSGTWPYSGEGTSARLAVVLAVPAALLPAATLAFHPAARHPVRDRALAFALLLTLYLLGSVNQSRVGWQVQGLLLAASLCLWVLAWRGPSRIGNRGLAWMLAGVVLAMTGALALGGGDPLLDYRTWNPFGPTYAPAQFNWNQTYGPLSWPNSGERMFTVKAAHAQLWRITTLDRFDGVRFSRSAHPPSHSAGLDPGPGHGRWLTRATFTIDGLDDSQLLSAGAVTNVSLVAGGPPNRIRAFGPDGSIGVAGRPLTTGARYTVLAYAPRPSAQEMRGASLDLPAAYVPYTAFTVPTAGGETVEVTSRSPQANAAIRASPYARVWALAKHLDAGADGWYDVAQRVMRYLRNGYVYDERPARTRYPLVSFLFSQRRGYCQQFSGAMALLLRMNGIPARIASGFTPGTLDPHTHEYVVTAHEAHAWVEVYFPRIGWVPFDPTPKATKASISAIAAAKRLAHEQGGGSAESPSLPSGAKAVLATPQTRGSTGLLGLPLGVAIALLLIAIGAAAASVLEAVAWRSRRRHAGKGAGALALHELLAAAGVRGILARPSMTLSQLERDMAAFDPAAVRYVRMLSDRLYGPGEQASTPSLHDRRMLRRALGAQAGLRARLRLLAALPPAGVAVSSLARTRMWRNW
ncbi:MAG TPA: transglutaminase domain-containing protein [Solirubrobacteraceae bacterium]|nr:transglutaminase domain-containing protein [Solirubrobacteraceae bacterium]